MTRQSELSEGRMLLSKHPDRDRIDLELISRDDWTFPELAALAERESVRYDGLWQCRRYLQQHGWSCPLNTDPCTICGKPLLTSKRIGCQRMHRRCNRRRNNGQVTDTGSQWLAEAQEAVTQSATRKYATWTEADDRYLIEHQETPLIDLASALNRTIYSVTTRQTRLRRRGLLGEPVRPLGSRRAGRMGPNGNA